MNQNDDQRARTFEVFVGGALLLFVVALILKLYEQNLDGISLADLSNAATALAFVVAAAAAVASWRQLSEARLMRLSHEQAAERARRDQARPYVMVSFEQTPVMFNGVDIVIQNVGAGPAYDVRIESSPALTRAKKAAYGDHPDPFETRYFREPIPLMPPGYNLRTFFDDAKERFDNAADERFVFTVSYHDGQGDSWTETSVQDLGIMRDLLFTETLGEHHSAKALREIKKVLEGAALLGRKPELPVSTESRAERAERLTSEADALRDLHESRKAFYARRQGVRDSQTGSDEAEDAPEQTDGA